MGAKYHIFQMIPDLFRREPRNVGVVAELNGHFAARFLGETDVGDMDGRKIRSLPEPAVYRQWISYWRRTLNSGGVDALVTARTRPGHFHMICGGEVTDTGEDSVSAVADYLYSLLVSEGGFSEAVGEGVPKEVNTTLIEEVEQELARLNILESAGEQVSAFALHPVQRRVEVRGANNAPYRPPFVQRNGALYVIETADLDTRQRSRIREHAGHAAYMFSDLRRELKDQMHAISIVYGTEDTLDDEAAAFTLNVLANESEVIHWWKENERGSFLEERRRVAVTD